MFAGVKAPIIDLKNVETIGVCLGKLIQEPLIAIGIQMRELQKEGFTRCWFDASVEPKRLEQPAMIRWGRWCWQGWSREAASPSVAIAPSYCSFPNAKFAWNAPISVQLGWVQDCGLVEKRVGRFLASSESGICGTCRCLVAIDSSYQEIVERSGWEMIENSYALVTSFAKKSKIL